MTKLDITHINEQKRSLVEALLPLCPFVLLDGSAESVTLPESLRQKDLVLRLGRDPKVMGMPDLVIDQDGFRVTISLRGTLHWVNVPWDLVTRCWVGDPFIGPVVIWPDAPPRPENEAPKPKGLRLVKN